MGMKFGVKPTWKMKKFENKHHPGKPYIVVRPVTVRKEWRNEARNPLPEYIVKSVDWLTDHYTIISVADVEDKQEWFVDEPPYADIRYHRGELNTADLLGLCQGAAGVIGGVGWIVPFAVHTRVPSFIVSGGNGGYNHPAKLLNPTMALSSNIVFAVPDDFCKCTDNLHRCNKQISDLRTVFNEWQSIL